MKRETNSNYKLEDPKKQRTQVQGFSFKGDFITHYNIVPYNLYSNPQGYQYVPVVPGISHISFFNSAYGYPESYQYGGIVSPGGGHNINISNQILISYPQSLQYNIHNGIYQNHISTGATVQGYGPPNRTIYLGKVPSDVTFEEIFDLVKEGMVEAVRILREKNSAFIAYIDASAAANFYQKYSRGTNELSIRDNKLSVNWGNPGNLNNFITYALSLGASRCVYIGNIDLNCNPDFYLDRLSVFGPIEKIRIIEEKKCAFIYFTNIQHAIKCVNDLTDNPEWYSKNINYGKDRCDKERYMQATNSMSSIPMFDNNSFSYKDYNSNMRQIYIGNLLPETTTRDICDEIRVGKLVSVRLIPEKNAAFVVFVEPFAASQFLTQSQTNGCIIKGKLVKVNWGKPQPLKQALEQALRRNASRVLSMNYNANITTDELLRDNFGEFGEIEQISIFENKNSVYVNFNNVSDAIKAYNALCTNINYLELNLRYGRDLCAPVYSTTKSHPFQLTNN